MLACCLHIVLCAVCCGAKTVTVKSVLTAAAQALHTWSQLALLMPHVFALTLTRLTHVAHSESNMLGASSTWKPAVL